MINVCIQDSEAGTVAVLERTLFIFWSPVHHGEVERSGEGGGGPQPPVAQQHLGSLHLQLPGSLSGAVLDYSAPPLPSLPPPLPGNSGELFPN